MNRVDLAAKLKEQRARRLMARKLPPSPSQRKKTNSALPIAFVINVSIGLFILFRHLSSPPAVLILPIEAGLQSISETEPSPVPLVASPTLLPSPITMIVCTQVSNGRMNVHFEPGAGKDVRGYLKEGEIVTIVENTDVSGSMWFRLSSPVAGWANSRYLCEGE